MELFRRNITIPISEGHEIADFAGPLAWLNGREEFIVGHRLISYLSWSDTSKTHRGPFFVLKLLSPRV